MNIVISDYNVKKGGAGKVAELEFQKILKSQEAYFYYHNSNNPFNILAQNLSLLVFSLKKYKSIKRVYIHNFSLWPVVILLTHIFKKKCVLICHDYVLVCPSKSKYDSSKQMVCNIEGYSSKCAFSNCGYSRIKKIYSLILIPLISRKVNIRLLNSAMKIFFEGYGFKYIFSARNIKYYKSYDNLLAMHRESQEIQSIDTAKKNVLFAGRYTHDKGYDIFLQIAKKNKKFNFISCGAGEIESNNSVIDLGWIDELELLDILSKVDLVLYPSRQLDADPVIFQYCYFLDIPIVVPSHNIIAGEVSRVFGTSNSINFDDFCNIDIDRCLGQRLSSLEFKEEIEDIYEKNITHM